MFLPWEEIKQIEIRYIIVILVIACISFMIYFVTGLAVGLVDTSHTTVDYWKAGGIILSRSSDKVITASLFDKMYIDEIAYQDKEAINVFPALSYINGYTSQQNQINIVYLGVETNSDLVPPIVEGHRPENLDETVVSVALKQKKIQIGDTLEIANTGRRFTIVGFTELTSYSTIPVAYVDLDMASQSIMTSVPQEYEKQDDTMSEVSKEINGIVIQGVNTAPKHLPQGLEWVPMMEFIKKIPGYQEQVVTYGLIIGFMIGVTSIIIGIFPYILAVSKKSLFSLLEVKGMTKGRLTMTIVLQAVILTFIGLLLGFIMNCLIVYILPDFFPIEINMVFYSLISIVAIVCACVGALLSIWMMSKGKYKEYELNQK